MTHLHTNHVLAVDGGGTRCRLALWSDERCTIVEKGPTNINTSFDASVNTLLEGLGELAGHINIEIDELHNVPAFVGLSGLVSKELEVKLETALPLSHCRLADDRIAALKGALGDKDGVVAHCGTGSFFASQIEGHPKFSGGWGPILGDTASAQWVGRQILSKTLEALDGYVEPSPICDALLSQFEGSGGIIAFARVASPHQFGEIAPQVTQYASNGDPLAKYVLQKGAQYLANHIDYMGWKPETIVCLTGGIGPYYKDYLPEAQQSALCPPSGEPLDGAIILAKELREKLRHECR